MVLEEICVSEVETGAVSVRNCYRGRNQYVHETNNGEPAICIHRTTQAHSDRRRKGWRGSGHPHQARMPGTASDWLHDASQTAHGSAAVRRVRAALGKDDAFVARGPSNKADQGEPLSEHLAAMICGIAGGTPMARHYF